MKSFLLSLLSLVTAVCAQAVDDVRNKEVLSPDGRFAFHVIMGETRDPVVVTEKKGGNVVWNGSDEFSSSFLESIRCVWAPDSAHFAFNWREGGRYETTKLFRWDGKTFQRMPDPEDVAGKWIEAARNTALKNQGVKQDAYQRRIWDKYAVEKWIDSRTIQLIAYSIRLVTEKDAEEGSDVFVGFRYQLRLDKKGKWTKVVEETISEEEATKF